MANEPVSAVIAKIESAYKEMERGATASSILNTLDPILEKRLGTLLDQFRQCPPELGALLDHRAKICEVWSMRKELKDASKLGKSAAAILEAMISKTTTS